MQHSNKFEFSLKETFEEGNTSEVDDFVEEENIVRRDTSKIYFFIIAILALIATNIYFYIKYKSSEDYAYGANTERVYMQDEIDRIEAEMNRISGENIVFSEALQASRDSVKIMISSLRESLNQQNLSTLELSKAQETIDKLRVDVLRYKEDMSQLKAQNTYLLSQNENLEQEVSLRTDELSLLEEENLALQHQLKSVAVLKLSNIDIIGVRDRSRNREATDNKARKIDKLRISYSIADNPLVEMSKVNIYIRVIDPSGNLITKNNQHFELSGNPMQYTSKTNINFTNQGESYSLEWKDETGFKKGTYTIVLYTEDSNMGRSSIILN